MDLCLLVLLMSILWGFPGGSVVKNPPAMQEMQEMLVQSLSWEDPMEEGMATHANILAWRIPWIEEPGRIQSIGSQRVRHDWSNWACTHPLVLEQFVKRLSLLYWIFLQCCVCVYIYTHIYKYIWTYTGLFILFLWSICLYLSQFCIVLIIIFLLSFEFRYC